jgi:hypothetical protein
MAKKEKIDHKLMKSIKDAHHDKEKHHKKAHKKTKLSKKMGKVMHEFKEGELHSGSKKGPKVTNPKQAVAIAYSEGRKEEGKEIKKTMRKHKKKK